MATSKPGMCADRWRCGRNLCADLCGQLEADWAWHTSLGGATLCVLHTCTLHTAILEREGPHSGVSMQTLTEFTRLCSSNRLLGNCGEAVSEAVVQAAVDLGAELDIQILHVTYSCGVCSASILSCCWPHSCQSSYSQEPSLWSSTMCASCSGLPSF